MSETRLVKYIAYELLHASTRSYSHFDNNGVSVYLAADVDALLDDPQALAAMPQERALLQQRDDDVVSLRRETVKMEEIAHSYYTKLSAAKQMLAIFQATYVEQSALLHCQDQLAEVTQERDNRTGAVRKLLALAEERGASLIALRQQLAASQARCAQVEEAMKFYKEASYHYIPTERPPA